MSEWKEYKLGGICDVRDGTHDSPKQSTIGKPLITSKNIKGGNVNLENTYLISEEDFVNINKRSKVDRYDILFSMIGTVGESAIVKAEPDYAIKNVGLFKTGGNENLAKWIYYYLKSNQALGEIDANLKGSTQQYISLGDLRKFPIEMPSPAEQERIAGILSSLDDKIDLLNRQNATLEAMAETLFRHHFIENPKDDWKESVIADIIDFNPTRKLSKDTIAPFLEMSNLSTTTYAPNGWYDRAFSSGTKFKNGDTLLARITPCLENGKTAYVDFLEDEQVAWGSTEYIVMHPKCGLYPFFAYIVAKYQDFRDYAESCMSGSSGRQRVDVDNLKGYEIKMPDFETIRKFNIFIEPTVAKMNCNNKQIRSLTKLHNILLPKLMNNEIKIQSYD